MRLAKIGVEKSIQYAHRLNFFAYRTDPTFGKSNIFLRTAK
jgi:hypothetical protein